MGVGGAPGAPLEVVGGSATNNDTANVLALTGSEHIRAIIDTSSTGGHQAPLVLESNSNEVSIATAGSNEMRFNAGGSERVRIISDGNVGIGNAATSPSTKLTVQDSGGTALAKIYQTAGTVSAGHDILEVRCDDTSDAGAYN